MIETINKMLEKIVDRIEIALPNTTSIDKIASLGILLVSIKQSFIENKSIYKTEIEEIKEEI